MAKPTAGQQGVEKLFPAIAQWVRAYGHIEIGDQEMFGFVARAKYAVSPFSRAATQESRRRFSGSALYKVFRLDPASSRIGS
jgi:hypothetical protein